MCRIPGRAPVWLVQHALDPERFDQADLQMKVSIATSWSWQHRTGQVLGCENAQVARMRLQGWLQNSRLVQHATSPDEIKNLLAISDRDLVAYQVKQLTADWRCAMAYDAALQAATAA